MSAVNVPFPLWLWSQRRHCLEWKIEDLVILGGTIEEYDNIKLRIIVLDDQGRQCFVRCDEHHDVVEFTVLDRDPIDTSIELLALMREQERERSERPKRKLWPF